MSQEEIFLQKRICDLAQQSFDGNKYTFSGFLSLSEQDIFYQTLPELPHVQYALSGGAKGCERQMLRFGSAEQLGYEEEFPIACIRIAPKAEKFAGTLSHRDFLGALMHLGIDRSKLGDILVREKTAYLFCHERVQTYIIEQLDQVRRTSVECTAVSAPDEAAEPVLQQETLIVPSLRLDSIVAKLYHLPRSRSARLFQDKKVFISGRCVQSHSAAPREGDVVSVRGYGRFRYEAALSETKKGNLNIRVSRYV